VVCVFATPRGPFVLVLVGATIVGSMATVWHGVVNPPRVKKVREWHYPEATGGKPVALKLGEEMGRFLLGSTVVMLFPKASLQFNPSWQPGGVIRMGEPMANYA
jgi:phosphatidylserine decarboxylase